MKRLKWLADGSPLLFKLILDHHLLQHLLYLKFSQFLVCITGCVKTDRITVWIVGSSIIKKASIAARNRPGGWSLGLNQRGVDIWWQGYGGLKFIQLVKKVRYLATSEDPPKYLLIHCGANDLGQTKLQSLLHRIKADIKLLSGISSHTTLIWSFLLPRISWRHSQNVKAIEQARNRLNRWAANQVFACGGKILTHPQFIGKPAQLYHSDRTHLSDLGNYIFLSNIQGALEYFANGGESKEFPCK
ncbi:uncharacterized protein LOC125668895 [Ostrea edulis]|uniref:uncharacterized protein LOC125668895 n=1 Tax=Ostrea edulis TaxID=37623 RepID=UPI0024AF81F9|nr:uncharacterized protein LOC125668895 [Ostrea edulis]